MRKQHRHRQKNAHSSRNKNDHRRYEDSEEESEELVEANSHSPNHECVNLVRKILPQTRHITVQKRGERGKGHSKRGDTTSVEFHLRKPPTRRLNQHNPEENDPNVDYARELCRLLTLEEATDAAEIDPNHPDEQDRKITFSLSKFRELETEDNGRNKRMMRSKKPACCNEKCKRGLLSTAGSNSTLGSDEEDEFEAAEDVNESKQRALRRRDSDDQMMTQLEQIFQQIDHKASNDWDRNPFRDKPKASKCRVSPETLRLVQNIGEPHTIDNISKRGLKRLLRKELIEEDTKPNLKQRHLEFSKSPGVGRETQTECCEPHQPLGQPIGQPQFTYYPTPQIPTVFPEFWLQPPPPLPMMPPAPPPIMPTCPPGFGPEICFNSMPSVPTPQPIFLRPAVPMSNMMQPLRFRYFM